MTLNKDISTYFLSDARDFLMRYKLLKEKATYIGLRSKLLTELLFSIECALKSLIFFESTENENLTYKKAKKQKHDLNKLYDCLSDNSKQKYKEIITIDLSKYEVYNRYQLESEIDFRDESGVLGVKYYSTIANFNWLDNIFTQIERFIKYVESLNKIDLTTKTFGDMNIEEELNKHKSLINIRRK